MFTSYEGRSIMESIIMKFQSIHFISSLTHCSNFKACIIFVKSKFLKFQSFHSTKLIIKQKYRNFNAQMSNNLDPYNIIFISVNYDSVRVCNFSTYFISYNYLLVFISADSLHMEKFILSSVHS